MARDGDMEIDRALEGVVGEINSLVERQDGGPPIVLTVGGLVIGGTIILTGSGSTRSSMRPVRRSRCTPQSVRSSSAGCAASRGGRAHRG